LVQVHQKFSFFLWYKIRQFNNIQQFFVFSIGLPSSNSEKRGSGYLNTLKTKNNEATAFFFNIAKHSKQENTQIRICSDSEVVKSFLLIHPFFWLRINVTLNENVEFFQQQRQLATNWLSSNQLYWNDIFYSGICKLAFSGDSCY
jgi:hypothetical protein